MNISKENSYFRTLNKIVADWYESTTQPTAYKFLKMFGFKFTEDAFHRVFVTKETSIPVSAASKLLFQLGYEVSFCNIHGEISFENDFRMLLKDIINPYRFQYLTENNILTRSRYNYIHNCKRSTGRLNMNILDFTYLIYKLNVKMIIRKSY